jgi:hypothetical protein
VVEHGGDKVSCSQPVLEDAVARLTNLVVASQAKPIIQDKRGTYTAKLLIQALFLADLLKKKANLKKCIEDATSIVLTAAEVDQHMAKLKSLPSQATLSKYTVSLDAAYCLYWHRRWAFFLSSASPNAVNVIIDSSPQFETDWLLCEASIVTDVNGLEDALTKLELLTPDIEAFDEAGWEAWLEGLSPDERVDISKQSQCLCRYSSRHMMIPTALASRHGGLVYKLHAFLHAFFIDAGSWSLTAELMGCIGSITTDQGVERLLSSVAESIENMKSWQYLPQLDVWKERPPKSESQDQQPGIRGGADAEESAAAPPFPHLVASLAGGWAERCRHPGCSVELHCCCPECRVGLCVNHYDGERPSRCHEHNVLYSGMAGICPCPECRLKRKAPAKAMPPPKPPPPKPSASSSGSPDIHQRQTSSSVADALLHMCVWIPGCMHILHNAIGSVTVAMDGFKT